MTTVRNLAFQEIDPEILARIDRTATCTPHEWQQTEPMPDELMLGPVSQLVVGAVGATYLGDGPEGIIRAVRILRERPELAKGLGIGS